MTADTGARRAPRQFQIFSLAPFVTKRREQLILFNGRNFHLRPVVSATPIVTDFCETVLTSSCVGAARGGCRKSVRRRIVVQRHRASPGMAAAGKLGGHPGAQAARGAAVRAVASRRHSY